MMPQLAAPASAVRFHEELFAYWSSCREAGRLPARAHLDPCQFKRHLPTVSLIDVRDEPRDYRLRLAGTGLYGVYGREITGKRLQDVYNDEAAAYWRCELDKVVEEARPSVGIHSMAWRGAAHMSIFWIRLPLATDGERVDMILGYDAPIGLGAAELFSGIRAA